MSFLDLFGKPDADIISKLVNSQQALGKVAFVDVETTGLPDQEKLGSSTTGRKSLKSASRFSKNAVTGAKDVDVIQIGLHYQGKTTLYSLSPEATWDLVEKGDVSEFTIKNVIGLEEVPEAEGILQTNQKNPFYRQWKGKFYKIDQGKYLAASSKASLALNQAETGALKTFSSIDKMMLEFADDAAKIMLDQDAVIVGHNIESFDKPALISQAARSQERAKLLPAIINLFHQKTTTKAQQRYFDLAKLAKASIISPLKELGFLKTQIDEELHIAQLLQGDTKIMRGWSLESMLAAANASKIKTLADVRAIYEAGAHNPAIDVRYTREALPFLLSTARAGGFSQDEKRAWLLAELYKTGTKVDEVLARKELPKIPWQYESYFDKNFSGLPPDAQAFYTATKQKIAAAAITAPKNIAPTLISPSSTVTTATSAVSGFFSGVAGNISTLSKGYIKPSGLAIGVAGAVAVTALYDNIFNRAPSIETNNDHILREMGYAGEEGKLGLRTTEDAGLLTTDLPSNLSGQSFNRENVRILKGDNFSYVSAKYKDVSYPFRSNYYQSTALNQVQRGEDLRTIQGKRFQSERKVGRIFTSRTPWKQRVTRNVHAAGIPGNTRKDIQRNTQANTVPGYISAKDDAYNTIEALRHDGYASQRRRKMTDFGSGYRGLYNSVEILMDDNPGPYNVWLGASTVGHPAKGVAFGRIAGITGEKEEEQSPYSKASMELGTAYHRLLEKRFEQKGAKSEVLVEDPILRVRSYADVVFENEVMDIKSLTKGRYETMMKNQKPYMSHILQTNWYAKTMNLPYASINYYPMEDPNAEPITFRWKTDDTLYKQAVSNFMAQRDAMAVMAEERGIDWNEFPQESALENYWKHRSWKEFLVSAETQYKWALEDFQKTKRGMPSNLGAIRASRRRGHSVNIMEGLGESGMSGDSRKEQTDFGSGYRIGADVSSQILASTSVASRGWGERQQGVYNDPIKTGYTTESARPSEVYLPNSASAEFTASQNVYNVNTDKKVTALVSETTSEPKIPAVMAEYSRTINFATSKKFDTIKSKTSSSADKEMAINGLKNRERKQFSADLTKDATVVMWMNGKDGGRKHIKA